MSKNKAMTSKGLDRNVRRKQDENQPAGDREAMNPLDREPEPITDEEDRQEVCEGGPAPPDASGESEDGSVEEAPDPGVLRAALEKAEAQSEEYLNLAQRVQADFDNFRRRNQNLRREAFDDGARAFVTTLLPVVDNLERAIDAAKESPDPALREGVEIVCRQLLDAFEKRGVQPINRLGERFDPNLENAVLQGSPEDGEPGAVCEVFQKGYQMGDVILRHAMVKVVPE